MPNGKGSWEQLIARAAGERPAPVTAHTFHQLWQTNARPALLECDDGGMYVVKGRQMGRVPVNDQIVGHLGAAIEAPVPHVALVVVPDTLIVAEPNLAHFTPGIAHGSTFVPKCGNAQPVTNVDGQNRLRFARLAILFGWVQAGDHQFIYENELPNLVYSVDHGHFFPSGPGWQVHHLQQAPPAVPDPMLVSSCGLNGAALRDAAGPLQGLQASMIATAMAAPSEDWGITMDERIAAAEYFDMRRNELLAAIAALP